MLTPFVYDLPPEQIAARPVKPYHAARLLIVDRKTGAISESTFAALPELLSPQDLLVLNKSSVRKARLFGKLASGGEVELVLMRRIDGVTWEAIGRPLRKLKVGTRIEFNSRLQAECGERFGENGIIVRFTCTDSDLNALIEKAALMPIPPYIRAGRADVEDETDYQCAFADPQLKESIAAPTAGLHFTSELLAQLQAQGIAIDFVTLHLGAASFLAVWNEEKGVILNPAEERFQFEPQLWQRFAAHRNGGGRLIAVGTTTVRALESGANQAGTGSKASGELKTDLFILPGYRFQLIDALITNFHQPGTTHLLMVEALLGRELLEKVYSYALTAKFRFLSYGDGMLIL